MTTTARLTPEMQKTVDMLKAGHVIWKDHTKQQIKGLIYIGPDGSILSKEECMKSCGGWSVHASVLAGLLERGLIIEREYHHDYTDWRGNTSHQIHPYYELAK